MNCRTRIWTRSGPFTAEQLVGKLLVERKRERKEGKEEEEEGERKRGMKKIKKEKKKPKRD
jgi:hypothetical protein